MSTTFETTDMALASEMLSQAYGAVNLRSSDGPSSLSMVQHDVGRLRLDQFRYRMTFEAQGGSTGLMPLCRVLEGTIAYHTPGLTRTYGRGDVFLSFQPEDPVHAHIADLNIQVAVLDQSVFGEVAETSPDTPGPVRLLDYAPVSKAAAAQWSRTYDFVQTAADHLHPELDDTLYVPQLRRLFAAATLTAFPNTSVRDPNAADRHDAHPATLRRAVALIESHPDLDLSAADIAQAAGVSIRALQLTFRQHLETTPMTYLRRVRLSAVHAELASAEPGTTTVATVAARWGFYNFGRFAGQYRTEFGELPSQTLAT